VTGVLAAVWLFARHRDRPAGAWVVGLWLLMAGTSLTKGLLGFALPGVVFVVYGTWTARAERRSIVAGNRWLFNRWTLLAAPLGVAVYFLPFALSMWETGASEGLRMVWRENVRRFFAPHNHTGPVYLYAGVIFLLAAPWSAFLLAALVPPRRADAGDRLARAFFWAVFLFFTLSASRRSYYLLPVLPAVALLIGRVLTASAEELRPWALRLRTGGYATVFALVALAGLGLLAPADVLPTPYNQLPPLPARWALAVGWLFGLAVILRRGRQRPLAVANYAAFAGLAYVLLIALPATEEYRTRRNFADEVRARVAAEPGRLALFHARDVVFDLRPASPIPAYQTAEELTAAVRDGRVRWVLARRRYLALVDLPTAPVLDEAVQPWEGRDQIGDKMVLLDTEP
jgi:4-amino-4-deoxy-L-arabinose transferase-like glycosyltransferase